MGAVLALDALLESQRVWRGGASQPRAEQPEQATGHAELDARLPSGGWIAHGLNEILLAYDGMGELALLTPMLRRLTQAGERLALVAPPYRAHAPGWCYAGIDLAQLVVVQASARDALWATEQCLRSGACAAVLCWPQAVDDRALRRLQVAAETGQAMGFAFRPDKAACNPSPAPLRLQVEREHRVRVLKCRGGNAPAQAIAFAPGWH